MRIRTFDSCSPCTSHPGLMLFHSDMFHGFVDEKTITPESCDVYRNAFFEPAVAYPFRILLLDHEIAEQLRPLVRGTFRKTVDAYVCNVPYRLGAVPDYLVPVQADLERLMLSRDEILLPRATSTRRTYVAFEPDPIRIFPRSCRREAPARHPRNDEPDVGEFICDEAILNAAGLVAVGFGLQMSEAVYDVLKYHVRLPYFRVLTLDL